ncbi:MAG: hypothetical protein H7301_05465 [Cryobacterium sp.]|nr:hypothetical protein [Oligoflexia bacterium]
MTKTDWNSTLFPLFVFLVSAMALAAVLSSCATSKSPPDASGEKIRATHPKIRSVAKPKSVSSAESKNSSEDVGNSESEKDSESAPIPSDVTEVSAPLPSTDPEMAFFCSYQALITKFEAYGKSVADARLKVKHLCAVKFGPSHCIDDEDLRCHETKIK